MYERRCTKLHPVVPPLTPDPRRGMGEMSRDELVTQNQDLKRITSAERRRHAAVERIFVKSLDELQSTLNDVRAMYIAEIAPKPAPSDGKAKQ